jgi:L-rhamnose mutarotase
MPTAPCLHRGKTETVRRGPLVERIASHLAITERQREASREEHADVPAALEAVYPESGAGLETDSVFEAEGNVFGYAGVEDPERIREGMAESDTKADWDEVMAPILEDDADPWMDEVYRMV